MAMGLDTWLRVICKAKLLLSALGLKQYTSRHITVFKPVHRQEPEAESRCTCPVVLSTHPGQWFQLNWDKLPRDSNKPLDIDKAQGPATFTPHSLILLKL